MAPLHHHFEMLGWEQVTVVIRFWIIAGLSVAAGLGIFYAEWVAGLVNPDVPRAARLLGAASARSWPGSASRGSPPPTTSPTSARSVLALDETADEVKAEQAELLEILGADVRLGAGRDRHPARGRRPGRHLARAGGHRAAARPGRRARHPGVGRGRAGLAAARPRPPDAVARRHRHQRQDHDRADARRDPARRRAAQRGGRQRRACRSSRR